MISILVRLLLDFDPEVICGLEVEWDELDWILLVRLVLESHGQNLQSPSHHLQLRVVQPAIHGGGSEW